MESSKALLSILFCEVKLYHYPAPVRPPPEAASLVPDSQLRAQSQAWQRLQRCPSHQISWEDWAAWSNLPWGDSNCSRSIWHKQYLVLV